MKKKIIFIIIFLIVIISGVYYWFFYNTEKVTYLTQKIQRENISQSIEAIGKVYAKDQVDVGAQVSGQIVKRYVDVGSRVKQGDLIAQIDKDKQQNDLDITKAQLQSAKANLESKKIALDIALRQYEREKKLYAVKATSLENLESQKNNYYTLRANVADLNAQVVQLEITLKNAQKDLDYTTITAPINGVIINVAVDEGQTVNANQNTPTIVRIANLDEMEVRMEIAEADVSKIKIGTELNFSLLSDPQKTYHAKIESIDPADTEVSDSSSNSNSSSSSSSSNAIYYYAKFYVPNKDNFLRIGMSVENEIIVASAKNAIVVPNYAIKNDDKGYYVEVLENDEVIKKYVKLGIKDAINTEILKGVNEGENLILSSSADGLASKIKLRF
ncbi:efflux RND transporter periplasmic adaptor subunit [Campylobacter sp. LH-2024]|uniref:Efflux RND transporter periplasmic adaptor subunit n=1 Tax=Campylobacter molothri TaxID=1032242 RepID=A0ACC5W2R0_9BACT|nr:efflux RND transporter periplasmic adaptor subunit [Campylobacter sp. RM10537]MBZ7929530.1 efflux RND transporter periplasmic adaptor subunit [Campylobacter sp. W0067]MBZ7931747.1 efflux RND transporter periplasmic adaptor subunit [Campylobacter sp. RM12910]MBZ7933829.1 efflux RND transporter periplasmic adaptor subunit [Campylobacter sp. W0065]MBZ7940695.1 efflux RND transporter periplasmic adaptor subunit [Campylobacter sp. W0047]MBZ7944797.1 efflux RND transporter periplasmic adaptor sub